MADYFTLEEFREVPGMGDSDKYPDGRVDAVAAALTGIIEREVGTSFISRSVTETITTDGCATLELRKPFARSVTTLTLNGDTVTPSDLIVDLGSVRYKSIGGLFTAGDRGNAVVTYAAGYATECPADLKEALMFAVRDRLMATSPTAGIDARRTSMITDQGTVNYVVAGKDHPTGYPDLDAAIVSWRDTVGLRAFGFA